VAAVAQVLKQVRRVAVALAAEGAAATPVTVQQVLPTRAVAVAELTVTPQHLARAVRVLLSLKF
jgi:hypothetical protein